MANNVVIFFSESEWAEEWSTVLKLASAEPRTSPAVSAAAAATTHGGGGRKRSRMSVVALTANGGGGESHWEKSDESL